MGKRILILSNHFITLYYFRRELIGQLLEQGHEVFLSMPPAPDNEFFSRMGCTIIPTPVARRGLNPFKDLALLLNYVRIIRRLRPAIVFSYTIKPNIYGALACALTGRRQVCNVTGTGATFLKKNAVYHIARWLYRISIRRSYKVFFQNCQDREFFLSHKMVRPANAALLPGGSGVNLEQFAFEPLPAGDEVRFIYIGRMMRIKGIDQYLECAKAIKSKHPQAQFLMAGFIEEPDYEPLIEQYHAAGIVEYLGFQQEITPWIEKCHCTILPSHGGEGVPNVLLESAAMGRACIASRIGGCNEAVEDGVSGYLFEAGDGADLTRKVQQYLELDAAAREAMSRAGRRKMEREFDRQQVIDAYLREVEQA